MKLSILTRRDEHGERGPIGDRTATAAVPCEPGSLRQRRFRLYWDPRRRVFLRTR